jgi:hypothetical protein
MKFMMLLLAVAGVIASSDATADRRSASAGGGDWPASPGWPWSPFARHGHAPGGVHVLSFATVPVVIDAPGTYVLTRDWDVSPSTYETALTIAADGVVVDLRGFTLDLNVSGVAVAIGGSNVTLRNGSLLGNEQTLDVTGSGLVLEHLTLSSYDAVALGDRASVRDTDYRAKFGMRLGSGSSIERSDLTCTSFCVFLGGDDSRVSGNRFESASDATIVVAGSGNVVARNAMTTGPETSTAVTIRGDRNLVRDNDARGADRGAPSIFAVVEQGAGNVIDGNVSIPGAGGERASFGLRFDSNGNFLGDNRMAALTLADFGGTVQTDWGGNVVY